MYCMSVVHGTQMYIYLFTVHTPLISFVPRCSQRGEEEWWKECLVLAVYACVKLTVFIAPLICIMTQPYLLFSINTSSQSKKVKQSPHGHFSMACSQCMIQLSILCIRQGWWECIVAVTESDYYADEYQNYMVSPDTRTCANDWNQAFYPPSLLPCCKHLHGYEANPSCVGDVRVTMCITQ